MRAPSPLPLHLCLFLPGDRCSLPFGCLAANPTPAPRPVSPELRAGTVSQALWADTAHLLHSCASLQPAPSRQSGSLAHGAQEHTQISTKASAQGPCAFVSASAAFTGLLLSERGCEPACFLPAVLRGALLYGQVRLQGIVTLVLLSTFLIYFHWEFFIRKLCETGLISEFRNIHPLAACPAQADSPDGRRRCWSSLRTLTPPGLRSGRRPGTSFPAPPPSSASPSSG